MKSRVLKKIMSMSLCCNLILAMSPVTFANAKVDSSVSTIESNSTVEAEQNTFDMVPVESKQRSTFYGNAGSCRIDYMSGSNSISWGVRLNAGLASFSGQIIVSGMYSTNNYSRTYYVSGSSGVIYLPSLSSGSYSVTLIGTGIGLDGKAYKTVPNARISFYR